MPSPEHETYRNHLRDWIRRHGHQPAVAAALRRHAEAALVLWELDLSAARPLLQQGYADNPRGAKRWDPVIILRCMLLALLVRQPSLNQWVRDLRACRVLQLFAGVLMDPHKRPGPGVGTLYDFFHRLHDGPSRRPCPHGMRPSEAERRRGRTPRMPHPAKQRSKAQRRRSRRRGHDVANQAMGGRATEKLVQTLKGSQTLPSPNDLLGRLGRILLEVGVKESGMRGLLGDLKQLVVCGDGSALPSGGNRHGKRTCTCPRGAHCACPRIHSDPDANIGYDSHRDLFFFGHHLYELVVSVKGHDVPIALRLDPASTSDFIAGPKTLEQLRKLLRDQSQMTLAAVILDAGHDGKAVYRFALHHDITPVIPLATPAPAYHPKRPTVQLSRRGVPLCRAGLELIRRGTNRTGGQIFGCAVKAKKQSRCPQAPEGASGFCCAPLSQLGHTVVVKTSDDERLFPPIPRNHPQHRTLMKLRSGCERSFSVKKARFKLVAARHRRASFWLIRSYLIAVLQHAMAWVADTDAHALLNHLTGGAQSEAA